MGFGFRAAACAFMLTVAVSAAAADPVGSGFTYQGRLTSGGSSVNADHDFQFRLYDAVTGVNQIGSTLVVDDLAIANGLFTVELDFGSGAFNGQARWLEIDVRLGTSSGSYTTLSPRQKVNPSPYAIESVNADTVDGQHASEFFQMRGEAHVIPVTTSSAVTNAANLQAAYAAAKALTPHALALSADNRAVVLVQPGQYDFGTTGSLLLDAEFVDVVGMSTAPEDQYLFGTAEGVYPGVIRQTANNLRIENLRVRCVRASGTISFISSDPSAYFPDTAKSSTSIRNCDFEADDANALSMRMQITYSGHYERCSGGLYAFGGRGVASGTFTDCVAGGGSFAAEGVASGTFTRCEGAGGSFGGVAGTATGLFDHCVAGAVSFGAFGDATSGRFFYCRGANNSFTETGAPAPKHLFCLRADRSGVYGQYSGND